MKKPFLWIIASLLALILLCPALSACDNRETSSNVLIVGTTMTVDSLNRLDSAGGAPGYNFDKIASALSQLTAVTYADGSYRSMLCNYDVNDAGTELTLTLNEGYTWHDGTPVTIDDIEFTLSVLKQNEDYLHVQKSSTSLTYTVCGLYGQLLAKISQESVLPKHLLKNETKHSITDETSVIGCGPYKFVGRNKEAGTITFSKYDGYPFASSIAMNTVIIKQYGSPDVMSLALQAGEIDLIFNYGSGIDDSTYAALQNNNKISLYTNATKSIKKVLFFNNQVMTNKYVKKAIAKSIDYEKLRRDFGSLSSSPSREGFVCEGLFGYKETQTHTRNIEEAKRLLKQEGYDENHKFRLELLVHSGTNDEQYAQLLKPQIEATGMVDVVFIEKGSDWQTYMQNGRHMASLATVTAKGYDFEAGYATRYTLAKNTSMLSMANPVAHGQMLIEDGYGNLTEYGAIIKAMSNAANESELREAVEKYQDYIVENTPMIALFYDGITQAASSKLTGVKADSMGMILHVKLFETLKKQTKSDV